MMFFSASASFTTATATVSSPSPSPIHRIESIGCGMMRMDGRGCEKVTLLSSSSPVSTATCDTDTVATTDDDDTTDDAGSDVVVQQQRQRQRPPPQTIIRHQQQQPQKPPSYTDEQLLGGEPCFLDRDVELAGIQHMIDALYSPTSSLSPEQLACIADPAMFVRHLRAEKGDVTKAIDKMTHTLQWKHEFGVADIITCGHGSDDGNTTQSDRQQQQQAQQLFNTIAHENETGKVYVRGYDCSGRAIMYMRPSAENNFAHHDDRAAMMNNMRHLVWNLEKAIACTAKRSVDMMKQRKKERGDDDSTTSSPPPLEKINLIIDYSGYQFAKHTPSMATSQYTLDILQKHYPERMFRAYVVNAPFAFTAFYVVIKPFVDPSTKEKIVFCGCPKSWKTLCDNIGGSDEEEATAICDQLEPLVHDHHHSSRRRHRHHNNNSTSKQHHNDHMVKPFHSGEYVHLPFNIGFGP